jgi:uncharacterized membrane protein
MKKILRYLFVGALSLMPLTLVVVLVNMMKDLGVAAFFKISNVTNSNEVTGILIVLGLGLFIILGYSIEKYGKSWIVSMIDRTFEKIPAIRSVYGMMKILADMFSGNADNGTKEVVLVEYPKDDTWVPAYVLNKHKGVSVLFVPTSPNPTSGYTVIVKDEKMIKTSLTLEEASKFIISMGADFVKKDEISSLIHSANKDRQA